MTEEAFFSSLREQADREIRGILDAAEKERDRLLERSRQEAGKEAAEKIRLAEAEVLSLRSKVRNEAVREGRGAILEAAHRVAGEALDAVRERLVEICGGEGGRAVLEGLLDECHLPEGATVRCRAEDRETIEGILGDRGVAASVEVSDIPSGGFTVVSDGGRFLQRNSFEDRIEKLRPRLMQAVALALPRDALEWGTESD